MTDRTQSSGRFEFAEFILDVNRGTLRKGNEDIKLRPQSYAVLKSLVTRQGRLVTKEVLQQEVWGSAVVTDGSLTQCIVDIRKAIGDSGKRVVKTVPRRGYMFDPAAGQTEVDRRDVATVPQSHQNRWVFTVVVGLALAAVVFFWDAPEQGLGPTSAFAPPENSIAVLPFVDLSEDQQLTFFGEGLSEEIISELASSSDLHVVARTSSFSFRKETPDIRAISKRLNVRYVLEGSVRGSGDQLRVVAQLIDSLEDKHLWSNAFSAEIDSKSDLQSEIASSVARALQVEALSSRSVPSDPVTLHLLGRARYLVDSRDLNELPLAIDLLNQALERDPDNVRILTEMGRARYQEHLTGEVSLEKAIANSVVLAERALALAPTDPAANAGLGWLAIFYERDFQESARRFRVAFEQDPRNVEVIRGAIPVWLTIGRTQEAVQLAKYLVRADPLCLMCHQFMVMAYAADGQDETAIEYIESLMGQYPDQDYLHFNLARIHLLNGNHDRAAEIIVDAGTDSVLWTVHKAILAHARKDETAYRSAMDSLHEAQYAEGLAVAYAATGEVTAALDWLERHYESTKFFGTIFRDRFFDPLRSDPRWEELVGRFMLSEENFQALDFPNVSLE